MRILFTPAAELAVAENIAALGIGSKRWITGLKRDRGLIGVQNHGDPVSFRNIDLRAIQTQGWIDLYNGENLDGWHENGSILLQMHHLTGKVEFRQVRIRSIAR